MPPSLGTVGRCSLSKRNEESKELGEVSLSHIPLPSGGVRGGCQGLGRPLLHIPQPPQYIIEIGHNHQQNEDGYACIFGTYHELFTRFTTRNDLVDEEKNMPTIKCRAYSTMQHKPQ